MAIDFREEHVVKLVPQELKVAHHALIDRCSLIDANQLALNLMKPNRK
jgi:hypothetical protein